MNGSKQDCNNEGSVRSTNPEFLYRWNARPEGWHTDIPKFTIEPSDNFPQVPKERLKYYPWENGYHHDGMSDPSHVHELPGTPGPIKGCCDGRQKMSQLLTRSLGFCVTYEILKKEITRKLRNIPANGLINT